MTTEPPAEIAERLSGALSHAFQAFTTDGQAHRDPTELTMSGLGGCTRRAAYQLSGTAPSEPLEQGEMRQANIGTMIHTGLLPHLATLTGGSEEIPVTLTTAGLTLTGSSDLYIPELALVTDLKTASATKLDTLGDTPTPPHRMQVAGYALALHQAGYPVEHVAWLYLNRENGQERILVEPFTDELAALVHERCAQLSTYADEPDAAPRDERGPGLSVICDQCPWLRACWGDDARPGEVGAQRILARDSAGVAEALRFYDDARQREKHAASDKEFARAMFADAAPGSYGQWQFTWSQGGSTTDKDAAVRMLRAAGLPVPTKPTGQRLTVKRSYPSPPPSTMLHSEQSGDSQ